MDATPDYVARIRRRDWEGLRALWTRIKAGHTPGWPPGLALEHLVLRAFELDGAEVRWPYEVKVDNEVVEQIDGAVYIGHIALLVETKDYVDALDVSVLAKMRSQLARRPPATVGLVVSRNGFTGPAMTLSRYFAPQTVLLIRGDELDEVLRGEGITRLVLTKYRECVEEGAQKPLEFERMMR